jgi:hypothetical protein
MASLESGNLLRRYQAGEHEAVWADMRALGPRVREAPHFEDAWAVARETMRRARHNVELIIRRLDEIGYRFWDGKQGRPDAPLKTVTFNGKVVKAWPIEARLAAMFDELRRLPLAQVTEQMLRDLRGAYHVAMYPWQDRSQLLKGQRFPLDAEVNALFEQTIRTAWFKPAELTAAMLEPLYSLHGKAIEQAIGYWKERGEEPPAMREKREAEERRRKEAEASDHRKVKSVFSPPGKKAVAFIRKLEKKGVLVPLSVRAWIEEVGSVNLAGAHPRLCFWADENFPGIYADPLMVVPDLFEMEGWDDGRESDDGQDPLDAVLGWDAKAKSRLAVEDEQLDYGYSVTLPNPAADAALKGEPHNTTFVDYLRLAFRWGGFPGWAQGKDPPQKELAFLTDGLLPI